MPEPISRSSVSQIASYGPPEELSSEPPRTAAGPTATPSLPPTLDLAASHAPLERASTTPASYEKCIAQHEVKWSTRTVLLGLPAGCAKGVAMMAVPSTILKNPQPAIVGCAIGAIGAGVASVAGGMLWGNMEGRVECDDLPKKL